MSLSHEEMTFSIEDMPKWVIPEVTVFKCYIQHCNEIEGHNVPSAKLHIEGDRCYIVQDIVIGNACSYTLGYKYSYQIRSNYNRSVWSCVKNIQKLKPLNHEL
jgi:hypothetical protein